MPQLTQKQCVAKYKLSSLQTMARKKNIALKKKKQDKGGIHYLANKNKKDLCRDLAKKNALPNAKPRGRPRSKSPKRRRSSRRSRRGRPRGKQVGLSMQKLFRTPGRVERRGRPRGLRPSGSIEF